MIKQFVKEAKKYFSDNLVAIVLFGSRVWGFFNKKSDYDLFIFLKKKVDKNKVIEDIGDKKLSFAYILTFSDLKEKIRTGSWASYITLLKRSKILYKTRDYDKILNWIKKYKISKRQIKEKYLRKKEIDIKESKNWHGFIATKYLILSIGNRLQMLTYFRFDLVEPNYLKNLKKNKDLIMEEEYELAKKLYKKMMGRQKIGRDKKNAILLLKKLHNLCRKF